MQCPECQSENRAERRFCANCGAPLSLACPECAFTNAPGEKFCGGCGKRLDAPNRTSDLSPSTPKDYTPLHLAKKILSSRSMIEGERKQVTVLFADIKGSLELIESSDPEDAQAIFDRAIRTMMESVHRYEGTVNKVLGDGLMALFGAPLDHEDHAVRACYAALAMQQAVRRMTAEVWREHGVEVQVRVGLNSGEVVVRAIGNDLSMDYDAVGPTTHLAARMEQLAIPGTIRLTHETVRLAEGFVQVKPLGPVPIKGLRGPIEVFELEGTTATRTRFQAALTRGLTQFIGRESEMRALVGAKDRAVQGRGQAYAVVGEPGVGKSRLFYEFTRSSRTDGLLVLETRAVSYGRTVAYLPVIELLRNYFEIDERDDARRLREKIAGKVLELDETLRPTLLPLYSLFDAEVDDLSWNALEPAQRRRRILEAVKAVLLRESSKRPVVVIFEDLHWIDGETQAFLDALVESLPAARILLLMNYRPEYRHEWGGRSYYAQQRVDPLTPAGVAELLDRLLGHGHDLAPLKQMLIARTEGNPFFIEESVRALVESGALVGASGAYHAARTISAIDIPTTVQDILVARIDRLSEDDKRVLQIASVIGKDVPVALLQAASELSEEELSRCLAGLQAGEFLYETRLFPQPEFTFEHALTHEVTYASLLNERRRTYHRRIAEAMESMAAGRLVDQAERLAHHYTEAGLPERALRYWRQAGQRSLERSANPAAISQLESGLKLLASMPETEESLDQRLSFLLPLGIAVQATKTAAVPEVERIYSEARDVARRTADSPKLFAALWGLWRYHRTQYDLSGARALANQLFDIARQQDDPVFQLQAHHALWTTLNYIGAFAEARDHVVQGEALYDREKHATQAFYFAGHDPCVCGRGTMAQITWVQGNPDQATSWSARAVSLARELEHPTTLVHALGEATSIYLFRREPEAVMARVEALITLAEEWGVSDFLARGQIQLGWAEVQMGKTEQGLRRMRATMDARRSAGSRIEELHLVAALIDALITAGHAEEAVDLVDAAVAAAESTGADYWLADLLRLKGEVLLAAAPDNAAVAEAHILRAIDTARAQGARIFELRATISFARRLTAKGRKSEALGLLSPLYKFFTEGFQTPDVMDAKALLDQLS